MGTWRWVSPEYCDATSSCVVVDAYVQLVLCAAAALFVLSVGAVGWLFVLVARRQTTTTTTTHHHAAWSSLLVLRLSSWTAGASRSKTTPMPLAVIQKDADEAHITSHKNSTKQAFEFMQQTQRVSRVDFATNDTSRAAAEPQRPSASRSLSFIGRISGSFSMRRHSRPHAADQTSDREQAVERRRASHDSSSKRSNPLPIRHSGSRRGSVASSVELDSIAGPRASSAALAAARHDSLSRRRPSETHSAGDDGPARPRAERSSSFRQRIATVLYPNFIKAIQSHSSAGSNKTPRERSATAFDVPSYQKRQKLAALSPEHRKSNERRGSVLLRHKRRLSVGKEAQIFFEVRDGSEKASVYEVKLKEITLVKRLAFGPLSEVYAALWRDTKVGVKLLMPREGVTDKLEEAVKNFRREIWVMNALRHPNIVKLIGASLTPTCYVLVMEYMSNGSLYEYLRDGDNFFPHQMVLTSALDVADGMRHIHASRVLQRDLKSKNCLVSENLVVKVADFGLSRFSARAPGEQYTFVGTPFWAAPEIIRHEPYDEKADVYSFAIVLWELVERRDPYESLNAFQVPLLVANDGLRPADFSKSAPLGLEQLMRQCWDANPDQRPSFDEIVETLQKWLAPTSDAVAVEADDGDLSVHVQRESRCANESQLNRFASSHDANCKAIPIVLSRGQTEGSTLRARQRRSSAIAIVPPQVLSRARSDRSVSRASNQSAPP